MTTRRSTSRRGHHPLRSLAFAAAVVAATIPALVSGQDPPTPPDGGRLAAVARSFDQRRAAVRSFRVEYQLRANALADMSVVTSVLGRTYLRNEDVEFAFTADKRYAKVLNHIAPMPGTIHIPEQRIVFDGKAVTDERIGAQIKTIPHVLIYHPKPDDGAYFPALYTNGVCLPVVDPGLGADPKQYRFWVSSIFRDAAPAVSESSADGVPCVLVELPGRHKIWFDPKMGYAVRRQELLEDGALTTVISCQDFQQLGETGWWPRKVEWVDVGPPSAPQQYRGQPLHRTTATVTRLEVNQPDHDVLFRPAIKGGSLVHNQTLTPTDRMGNPIPTPDGGPVVTYKQPAREEDLDSIAAQARMELGEHLQRRSYRKYLVVSAVVLAAALGVLLALRWRRKTRTAEAAS